MDISSSLNMSKSHSREVSNSSFIWGEILTVLKVFLDTPIFETEPESLELRRAIGVTDGPLCQKIMVFVPMTHKSNCISSSAPDKYILVSTFLFTVKSTEIQFISLHYVPTVMLLSNHLRLGLLTCLCHPSAAVNTALLCEEYLLPGGFENKISTSVFTQ